MTKQTDLSTVTYRQGADWPPYARRVLAWNWVTWVLNFADRGLIGPLLPLIIPALGLSYGLAGTLVSLFFVGYLSTFVGGFLSDKFGRKRVSVFSIIGYGIITCLTAFVRGPVSLGAIRVVTGIFEGFQYPTAAAWVSETYPYRRRGKALAIWETGYSLGTLFGIVVATVVAAAFGWRAPWPIVGGLSIIAGILFAKFVKERPRNETPGYDESLVLQADGPAPKYRDVLRIRNVWVVFVLHGLYNFTFWMAGTWVPEYVIKTRHLAFTSGGFLAAALFGGVTIGLVLNGYLADRFGRIRTISGLTFLSVICFVFFARASDPVSLYIFLILSGIFGAYISSVIALVTDTTNPQISGTAFGVALFGGEIGAVLGPVSGGLIAQFVGFQVFVYVLPAAQLAAALLVWLANEPRGERKPLLSRRGARGGHRGPA
ncbi:MAG: MFS transporter [Streptosporangiales bacterium]